MDLRTPTYAETGVEVISLDQHSSFAQRRLHARDILDQMEALRLLCDAFLDTPDSMLQEVVNAAIHLCGADSAGISLAQPAKGEAEYFIWVTVAGEWSHLVNSTLPRYPSPCGVCLDRGTPQIVRVGKRFFDSMGIEAPLVADGLLLPWEMEGIRGTIWIVAHVRPTAFDITDLRVIQSLADFAKMGVRRKLQDGTPLHQIGSFQTLTTSDTSTEKPRPATSRI